MARFINYGGNFMPRQPGLSTESSMFVFPVEANENALQALCDTTLNPRDDAGNPVHPDVEYRAITSTIFLLFMKMDCIASLHPQDCAKGVLRENELNVAIPLLVFERHLGVMLPARFVWYMPYLWIDSGVPMASGRETYGFPKMIASVSIPADFGEPAEFKVDAETWNPFAPTQSPAERCLVALRRTDGPLLESVLHVPDVGDFVTHLMPWLQLPPLAEPLAQLSMMFQGTRFVFLKQFRCHEDGDDACYQAIVEAPVSYPNFHGADLLAGEFEVKIFNYASYPLIQELGLAGADASGTVATQRVPFAGTLDIDFELGCGDTVWKA